MAQPYLPHMFAALTNPATKSFAITPADGADLTGLGRISTDTCTLRLNGAQIADTTTDQGTGVYSPAVLYVGRRTGASSPFNGRNYGLVVRAGVASGATLTNAERELGAKAGLSF